MSSSCVNARWSEQGEAMQSTVAEHISAVARSVSILCPAWNRCISGRGDSHWHLCCDFGTIPGASGWSALELMIEA